MSNFFLIFRGKSLKRNHSHHIYFYGFISNTNYIQVKTDNVKNTEVHCYFG